MQNKHAEAAWPANIPASHGAHESSDDAEDKLEYFPESQFIQKLEFPAAYWPGMHMSGNTDLKIVRSKKAVLAIRVISVRLKCLIARIPNTLSPHADRVPVLWAAYQGGTAIWSYRIFA